MVAPNISQLGWVSGRLPGFQQVVFEAVLIDNVSRTLDRIATHSIAVTNAVNRHMLVSANFTALQNKLTMGMEKQKVLLHEMGGLLLRKTKLGIPHTKRQLEHLQTLFEQSEKYNQILKEIATNERQLIGIRDKLWKTQYKIKRLEDKAPTENLRRKLGLLQKEEETTEKFINLKKKELEKVAMIFDKTRFARLLRKEGIKDEETINMLVAKRTAMLEKQRNEIAFQNAILKQQLEIYEKLYEKEIRKENLLKNLNLLYSELVGIMTRLTMAGGVGLVGIALPTMLATPKAMEYQQRLKTLEILGGVAGEDLVKAQKKALEVSNRYGISIQTIIDSFTEFIKAGYEVADALNVVNYTSAMAIVNMAELIEVNDMTIKLMRGFGISSEDVGNKLAKLQYIITETKADFKDFMDGIKYVAPLSQILGISFEEASVSLGVLTNTGLEATVGARSLRQSYNQLMQALTKKDELKTLDEWTKKWANVSIITEKGKVNFDALMLSLKKMGKDVKLTDQAFADLRVTFNEIQGLTALMGLLTQMSEYERILNEVRGTTIEQEFLMSKAQERIETMATKVNILRQTILNLIYVDKEGRESVFMKNLTKIVDKLTKTLLSPEFQRVISDILEYSSKFILENIELFINLIIHLAKAFKYLLPVLKSFAGVLITILKILDYLGPEITTVIITLYALNKVFNILNAELWETIFTYETLTIAQQKLFLATMGLKTLTAGLFLGFIAMQQESENLRIFFSALTGVVIGLSVAFWSLYVAKKTAITLGTGTAVALGVVAGATATLISYTTKLSNEIENLNMNFMGMAGATEIPKDNIETFGDKVADFEIKLKSLQDTIAEYIKLRDMLLTPEIEPEELKFYKEIEFKKLYPERYERYEELIKKQKEGGELTDEEKKELDELQKEMENMVLSQERIVELRKLSYGLLQEELETLRQQTNELEKQVELYKQRREYEELLELLERSRKFEEASAPLEDTHKIELWGDNVKKIAEGVGKVSPFIDFLGRVGRGDITIPKVRPIFLGQHGFHGWTQKPTLFMTSEYGQREKVDITPEGQVRGSNIIVNISQLVLPNVKNYEEFKRDLARDKKLYKLSGGVVNG